jgi:transforming growth factor-beta-induced protein
MRTSRTRLALVGLGLSVALTAAACSSDSDTESSGSDDATTTTAMVEDDATTTTAASGGSDMAMAPTGPGCASVPASGDGSFEGMADDPAATAASNNPLLSTLVEAVGVAGLGDTLNGPGPFTIFAPANTAFEKIPADTLNSVLADTATLTDILTYHVVPGEMSSDDLIEAGSVATVQGTDVMIEAAGDSFTVNGAEVLCADVPTANATVFIIGDVLMPA